MHQKSKQARQAQIELNIYKERIEDLEQTKNRNAFLENEIIHLRKQNDKLLNDHGQISDM